MRSDAVYLPFEEERHGSNWMPHVKTRMKVDPSYHHDVYDEVDVPMRMGRRARHYQFGWNTKSSGDFLSPLYGFLEKSIGRNWNDVYSEIRAVANKDSLPGYHLFQHLYQYVSLRDVHRSYATFFVDDDNILQKNYFGWSHYKKSYGPVEKIEFPDGFCFELRKGLWFEVRY